MAQIFAMNLAHSCLPVIHDQHNHNFTFKGGSKMTRNLTNKLLNLPPEIQITGYVSHQDCTEVFISFPESERICPDCGSHNCVIKSSPTKETVRHLPCSDFPVILTFKRRRLRCKNCGRTFYEPLDWLCTDLHMTFALRFSILESLTETVSCGSIGLKYCIPTAEVENLLRHLTFDRPKQLPQTLCIDEFKGDSGTWIPEKKRWKCTKYHCNIADGDSGVVIDVLPSIRADDIISYFLQYNLQERQAVKYFCCDMHNGYYNVARHCFPNAVICIDMFHVVKLLNDAMDAVRRRIQNDIRESDPQNYELLKHLAKALKTKDSNKKALWDDSYQKKQSQLNTIFSAFPDLQAMNDALQNFHVIIDENSYTQQRADLTEWLKSSLSSEIPELRSAAATIKLRRGYIQNSWKYLHSNGPCEGLNNKIKVLKRISFGVHNFELFRKRILLVCGYIHCVSDRSCALHELLNTQKEAV